MTNTSTQSISFKRVKQKQQRDEKLIEVQTNAEQEQETLLETTRRVMLIGLDGLDFHYIMLWLDELPAIRGLMGVGAYGPLRSTILPVTPPAWTSMVTGVNPGKHGIFHFRDFDMEGSVQDPLGSLINSTMRRFPAIWNILTEQNKKCVIFNVPVTYPPEEINGVMIAGYLTPPSATDFAYPKSYAEKLQGIGYDIGRVFGEGEKSDYSIDNIIEAIGTRTTTAMWLLDSIPDWDFFMATFMAADHVVHQYADDLEAIKRVYKKLDNTVAILLKRIPGDVVVIIASDHGIGPCQNQFLLNNWLYNKGFLRLKGETDQDLQNRLRRREVVKTKTRTVGRFYRLARWAVRKLPRRLRRRFISKQVAEVLDYEKTPAWAPMGSNMHFATIKINIPDNSVGSYFPRTALMNDIRGELLRLVDEEDGTPIVQAVHRAEFVWGPYAQEIPELIIELDERYAPWLQLTYDKAVVRRLHKPRGAHKLDGVFIAAGSGINTGTKLHPAIWDVAPTIYHILEARPPADLDGRVLREIFTGDLLSQEALPHNLELNKTFEQQRGWTTSSWLDT